jgi:hypothetical protein
VTAFSDFSSAIAAAHSALKNWGAEVVVDRWQGVDTSGSFREVTFYDFSVGLTRHSAGKPRPIHLYELQDELKPNLPWADDHFQERVGGEPLNPGDQYKNWPYWREESEEIALSGGKFSHTYMERFWPRFAGSPRDINLGMSRYTEGFHNEGIRFRYGELSDVVDLLYEEPLTRQAYVPIWFPEDTGAVHRTRVPCSIGYFFLMRNNKLHMRYHIRSCDINRYLRDDIYMAVRLQLWMLEELKRRETADDEPVWDQVNPGAFHMAIDSLHTFGGDFRVTQ